MIKFIAKSFTFKGIFSLKDYKKSVVWCYFFLLIFITSFSLNLAIFRNNGWKDLNTITLSWRENIPDWLPLELPNDCIISKNGLSLPVEETYYFETENGDKCLVINPLDKEPLEGETVYNEKEIIYRDEQGNITKKEYKKAIILCKNKVLYYNSSNEPIEGNYSKIEKNINFTELKSMNQALATTTFLSAIDSCFNQYMIFSNILINTGTQLLLNLLFVLIISAIFMLVRIKFQRVTTYSQNINIVISSMTIPSIISFIIGITGIIEMTALMVVLFQLIAPLIAIGAIYKGSNIKEGNIKYTA